MSREAFQKLREIDSLMKMKNKELGLVKDQDDRLSSLENKKLARQEQKDQDKKAYTSTQQELFEMEKKLKTASQQKERLSEYSPDDQKIKELSNHIEEYELKGFELIEKIEMIERDLKDHDTFLHGLENTMKEISLESLDEKNLHVKEAQNLEERIKRLHEELPDNFKGVYTRLMSKNFIHGPFTTIQNNACMFCRSSVSKVEESDIDTKFAITHCRQCGRLFLPYNAIHA